MNKVNKKYRSIDGKQRLIFHSLSGKKTIKAYLIDEKVIKKHWRKLDE